VHFLCACLFLRVFSWLALPSSENKRENPNHEKTRKNTKEEKTLKRKKKKESILILFGAFLRVSSCNSWLALPSSQKTREKPNHEKTRKNTKEEKTLNALTDTKLAPEINEIAALRSPERSGI
jgi:hypothetical protein